jgi:hypothetical protein
MRTVRLTLTAFAVAAALAAAACIDQQGNVTLPTSPTFDGSPATVGTLTGLWTSGSGQGTVDNCHSIQWNVTTQTETAVSGSFSAICANVVLITGTASGVRSGQNMSMQVNGIAQAQGVTTTCGFSLQGNGIIQGNDEAVLLNYSGTTCLGPVTGQELLRR